MNYRIFVQKKFPYDMEEIHLFQDLKENLKIIDLSELKIFSVYDVFYGDEKDVQILKENVLSEKQTDFVFDAVDLVDKVWFATEFLPGQYDQRSDSAEQCLMLLNGKSDVKIRSGKLYVFNSELSESSLQKIKNYMINPVESREKNLDTLVYDEEVEIEDVPLIKGFCNMSEVELEVFLKDKALAMSIEDLAWIQKYFQEEGRDPWDTEIKVLDTYWSDHCRHTTFETALDEIEILDGELQEAIQTSYEEYLSLRKETGREDRKESLMDMATIVGRAMRKNGKLDDLEVSDEINACSIEVDVDINGKDERWLLMFKNETHNHPTEIEPFGGASTCVGGAIRDPLSGRSYVYQAMRITGAGDITRPLDETLAHKLPQRIISKGAAQGYSSYGNQIGLTSTYVEEIYHPGYVAKRMEVGAVVGAVPKENVIRMSPIPGDGIILLGGRTGRDGIGGATGSSKGHTKTSLTKSASEVQKGNAPIERKIQRLFRNPKATRLIKKANDFGAGGVSVAIGELADGIHVYLDKVPVKYTGLNATELAISESQERMACVVAKEDLDIFIDLAHQENLEATIVAEVTEDPRLVMEFQGKVYVDLKRAFLNTNGVIQHQNVAVDSKFHGENPFEKRQLSLTQESIEHLMKEENVALQKGMVEMFDSSIGKSTVLMPYGGKYQNTREEGGVQKLPVLGHTETASVITYGFNPNIATFSPYLNGSYSVIDALARLTALGADYKKARLSCQEYFERLGKENEKWGKTTQALLGLISAQQAFETPAIGGKDSMSGSFEDIHVPPTLITFAVTTAKVSEICSAALKEQGRYLYLLKHSPKTGYVPDYSMIKTNFESLRKEQLKKNVSSASTIKHGGLMEALWKASFGNKMGFEIETKEDLWNIMPGSFLVETVEEVEDENWILLGETKSETWKINGQEFNFDQVLNAATERYEAVFPTKTQTVDFTWDAPLHKGEKRYASYRVEEPKVLIPVFPGTNCEYDTMKSFEQAGAKVEVLVFRNRTVEDVKDSVERLAEAIQNVQIIAFVGGFSAGDEPDGSGKFIANVLANERVKKAIEDLLSREGLILGICNGFQALIKSGLLPEGKIGAVRENSATLFRNQIGRHISQIVTTKLISNKSPWLQELSVGEEYEIAVSHGEGRIVVGEEEAKEWFKTGRVATVYVNPQGEGTMERPYNPNGSYYAVEGLLSPCGHIFGKMGHTERYEKGLYQNIPGNKEQNIFQSGVNFFRYGKEK